MRIFPMEVTASPAQPLGMSASSFLRNYWQKRPLLIRQAFPGFKSPITPNDLAGLACEPYVLSRLVVHSPKRDHWSVESGPIAESRFGKLPRSHWTLLVQDVDKWDADVATLYQWVDFLPSWRLDDIMISYAVKGGSVGAHIDQYDVFLLQGMGRRSWQIDNRDNPPTDFRDDVPLKLLQSFSPSHEWLLETGDVLYLPPKVPHYGVALDKCMTISLGMRAPSNSELILDLAESVVANFSDEKRYADPDLKCREDPYAIEAIDLERAKLALQQIQKLSDSAIGDWFGSFITRYRAAQSPAPRPHSLTAARLATLLQTGKHLHRHPFSRLASIKNKNQMKIFLAGEAYRVSHKLYNVLTIKTGIEYLHWQALKEADQTLLTELVNAGHFGLTS